MNLHYVKHFKKYYNEDDNFIKRLFPKFFKKEDNLIKVNLFVYDIGFVYYLNNGEPNYKKIRNCVEFYKNDFNDLVVISFNNITKKFEKKIFHLGRLDWKNSIGVYKDYKITTIKEIERGRKNG